MLSSYQVDMFNNVFVANTLKEYMDYSERDPKAVWVKATSGQEALCAALHHRLGYLQLSEQPDGKSTIDALCFDYIKRPTYRYLLHLDNGDTLTIHGPANFVERWNSGNFDESYPAFVFEYSPDLQSCIIKDTLWNVLNKLDCDGGWVDESSVKNLATSEQLSPDEELLLQIGLFFGEHHPSRYEEVRDLITRAARALNAPRKAARTKSPARAAASAANGKKGGRPALFYAVLGNKGSENMFFDPLGRKTEEEAYQWISEKRAELEAKGHSAIAGSLPSRVLTRKQARKEGFIK